MDSRYWIKIEKVNNVYGRVTTNHPTIFGELYKYMSIYADDYRFMPKYKMGVWDGKIPFINKSGYFQKGLLKYVYNFIKNEDICIEVDPALMERCEATDLADITNEWMNEKYVPYRHQFEGALAALKYQNCILEHATSSGKSLTMSILIMYNLKKNRAKKILVLVPGIGLVEQLSADFIDYGVPSKLIGKYYQDIKEPEKTIVISTWQSMYKQTELIKDFDMILVDEAHGVKAAMVRSVSENAINASMRIGCTGTMPDTKCPRMQIEGALGPVVHTMTARQLIDEKQASDIKIKIPYITYPKKITAKINKVSFDLEKEWLEKNDTRNEIIKKIVLKHHAADHNALILVEHLDHADALLAKFKDIEGTTAFLVTGATPSVEREQVRQFTNVNKKVVIIATYGVFSVGVSINRLHTIIFASAGKSKIKTLQSIGRGLRLHKEKRKLILYDIGDNLHYSDKHLQERINIYDKAEFEIDMFEINLDKE
jgi:superfamily II DNA or RNA helicase